MRNPAGRTIFSPPPSRSMSPSPGPVPPARHAHDPEQRRREVVQLFVEAREHLDRVVATLSADAAVASAGRRRSSTHGVSDTIAAAIDSLDLAFDRWSQSVEGPSV